MTNEDRSVIVLLNGEIYNYREIRPELVRAGHRFATDADTEVLVHGYEEWGLDGLLERCNGMFAFGLYDVRRERLFLVRDRLGKKPLYYALTPDLLVFSSELRGLVTGGFVRKEISPETLNHYTRLHFPYGEESLIKGVRRVLPGHYLTLDWRKREAAARRYWTLAPGQTPAGNYETCLEQLRSLLYDSVRLRRIADVPVGTFLSGGLDSSIVTGLMAGMVRPLNTFSIGFEETGFDESAQSALVASRFGTAHQHFTLTAERFADLVREIAGRMDEPVADAACVPTYWLSREARKKVTVVLTGEGSDELFAGYDHYREAVEPCSRISGFPFAATPASLRRLINSDLYRLHSLTDFYRTARAGYAGNGSPLGEAQMADITTWLVDDVLMKLDKMSMLHALEARAPFLDYRLVEFALALPDEFRLGDGVNKRILRDAYRDLLPKEITAREKQGFNIPLNDWFRGPLTPLVDEFLSPAVTDGCGFFNPGAVTDLVRAHADGRAQLGRLLYLILLLQMWWRLF
jgi:asparagine synthase (glutamine-hydrolysing)